MTNRDKINEATSASISSGKFQQPMVPGIRMFNKQEMQPYYKPTSKYDDAAKKSNVKNIRSHCIVKIKNTQK